MPRPLKNPQALSITDRIGKCESTLDDADLYRIGCEDFNHIKAEGNVWHLQESKPMHGTPADESLLFLIDGIERSTKFLTSTGLHLSKDKGLEISADKIDLPTSGGTEVPTKDFPPRPLKMSCCCLFTPAPQLQMIRTRRRAGRPVQNRGDDACKVHVLEA